MKRSFMLLGRRKVQKLAFEEVKGKPQVKALSAVHASSATTRIREERARMRSQMISLDGAFREGARAEEAAAMRSAPMRNGLKSKATGGALYEMQPVISSAHIHRQARVNGEQTSEENSAQDKHSSHSQTSSTSGGSLTPLLGLMAFGAAAALAIMEHDEIAEKIEGIKSLVFGSTQCDEKSHYEEQPDHIAAQPLHLQRQR